METKEKHSVRQRGRINMREARSSGPTVRRAKREDVEYRAPFPSKQKGKAQWCRLKKKLSDPMIPTLRGQRMRIVVNPLACPSRNGSSTLPLSPISSFFFITNVQTRGVESP